MHRLEPGLTSIEVWVEEIVDRVSGRADICFISKLVIPEWSCVAWFDTALGPEWKSEKASLHGCGPKVAHYGVKSSLGTWSTTCFGVTFFPLIIKIHLYCKNINVDYGNISSLCIYIAIVILIYSKSMYKWSQLYLVFHPVEGNAPAMVTRSHQPRAESKFCILHHTPLLTRFQVFSPWDLSSSAGGHLQTIPNQTNHWCWSSPPPRPRPLPAQTPPPQRPQRCSPSSSMVANCSLGGIGYPWLDF